MPKPRVTTNSRQYKTPKDATHWTSTSEAESIGSEQNLNKLSYLYGAVCDGGTNDMGVDGENYSYSPERRKLRRHTVEQGSSTFSWPQKP